MSLDPSDAASPGAKLDECPACGHHTSLDDVLTSGAEVARFADGTSVEQTELQAECPGCGEKFQVPSRQIEAAILERQTADLFSAMSQVLRGKAKLQ